MSVYPALDLKAVPHALCFDHHEPDHMTLDTPALAVMTDLAHGPRVSVYPDDSLEEAVAVMMRAGVRLAFVVPGADAMTLPIGLVAAADLLGERPMQIAAGSPMRRRELRVRDLMEPTDRWHVVDMPSARQARVGHIVATLQATGRRHLVVIQHRMDRIVVRGVFSATRIERALGQPIDEGAARSFADVEAAIAHD